jgi:hypothetical protein
MKRSRIRDDRSADIPGFCEAPSGRQAIFSEILAFTKAGLPFKPIVKDYREIIMLRKIVITLFIFSLVGCVGIPKNVTPVTSFNLLPSRSKNAYFESYKISAKPREIKACGILQSGRFMSEKGVSGTKLPGSTTLLSEDSVKSALNIPFEATEA